MALPWRVLTATSCSTRLLLMEGHSYLSRFFRLQDLHAGLGFPIRWNRPAHTGLYDQPQAAESLRAHRKPFCSRDKRIHHGFGHSSEGNTIVSRQLEKIGRVDHIAGDYGVVKSRVFVHNFF